MKPDAIRRPDIQFGDHYAVWYGPGGAVSDTATEIECDPFGADVREYQLVTGLIDNPPKPYLVTTYRVDHDDDEPLTVREAFALHLARMEDGNDNHLIAEDWADGIPYLNA